MVAEGFEVKRKAADEGDGRYDEDRDERQGVGE
jgi:hypothetical protein